MPTRGQILLMCSVQRGSFTIAWDTVEAKAQVEKKVKDNEFRMHHPHLAEWKEVRFQFAGAATDHVVERKAVCSPVPLAAI